MRRLTLIALWLSIIAPCHAELYKWVDENGRTHYGDSAAAAPAGQAVTPIAVAATDSAYQPADGDAARPRLAVDVRELPADKRAVGSYHYGHYCQQSMPIYWPEADAYHSKLMPDGGKLTGLLMQVLESLKYPVETNLAPGQTGGQSGLGLQLTATVAEADVKACVSRQPRAESFLQPEQIRQDDFDRLQINLTLDWLLADSSGHVLYRGRSSGRSGNLTETRYPGQAWLEVATEVAARLHNDAGFQAALAAAPSTAAHTGASGDLAQRQALMRERSLELPHILVTALPLTETRQQMGVLRAGEFCRNITPLLWPDIRNLNSNMAPDTVAIARAGANALANFDYRVSETGADSALAQQRRFNGLLLQIKVNRLYLDACAPDTFEPSRSYGQDSVRYSSYSRFLLDLSLEWTLFAPDGKQVFSGHTDSRAGSLLAKSNLPGTYGDAMQYAVAQLLGNADFQRALLQFNGINKVVSSSANPEPADDSSLLGRWHSLFTSLPGSWQQRTELAVILMEMSKLKPAMAEYYLSEGIWPTRFEQLGITTTPIVREATLILQPNGVLAAQLPASFGAGKRLLLRAPADPTVIGAAWTCETDVKQRPEACEPL